MCEIIFLLSYWNVICSSYLVIPVSLQRDANGAPRFVCHVCNQSFSRRSNLGRHFREKHVANKSAFICYLCGSNFTRLESLQKHMTHKHNESRQQSGNIHTGNQDTGNQHTGNQHTGNSPLIQTENQAEGNQSSSMNPMIREIRPVTDQNFPSSTVQQ